LQERKLVPVGRDADAAIGDLAKRGAERLAGGMRGVSARMAVELWGESAANLLAIDLYCFHVQ